MKQERENKRVFVFLDTMPQRQGSGANLRFYSNIQAYLDLGYEVEVIQVATKSDGSKPSSDLKPVTWFRAIDPAPPSTFLGRAAFRLGLPKQSAFQYAFPIHSNVLREARSRYRKFPRAVFHFDGESQANVIPWLPRNARLIWSLHDLPSQASASVTKIVCERENRQPNAAELRDLKFLQRAERLMARCSPLILCIGNHDALRLRNEWKCEQAEYFPMSIPTDGEEIVSEKRKTNGHLRLLHLGAISHLPSFRSLEFIFEHLFPLLPVDLLERISIDVVGQISDNVRAKKILDLAAPFKNVSFRGYVEDIIPYYKKSDAQIVASTDASGLRTRIIESFAFGLPVISTSVAAEGISGFSPGRHILIADDAQQFVEHLSQLIKSPQLLAQMSIDGRDFYLRNQGRRAVAASLSTFLDKYFGMN